MQQPFLYLSRNASPPRCVTILPMDPLHYPLLVRQLIMPSFLLPTLTSTEGRSMGSCRGLWYLNEQSLQSTVSTVSLSLNLQWKSVLPDSKLSIWSQFKNVRPLPFRIVTLAFVTTKEWDCKTGDWERERKIMKVRQVSRHVEKLNMGKRKEISEDDTRG